MSLVQKVGKISYQDQNQKFMTCLECDYLELNRLIDECPGHRWADRHVGKQTDTHVISHTTDLGRGDEA